jgi:hypothetical protein
LIALSDRQLQAVAPEDVKAVTLLPFRDMFRHNSRLRRPRTADDRWVDGLFEEVAADEPELSAGRLHDDGQPYEIDDRQLQVGKNAGCPFRLPRRKTVRLSQRHRHGRARGIRRPSAARSPYKKKAV